MRIYWAAFLFLASPCFALQPLESTELSAANVASANVVGEVKPPIDHSKYSIQRANLSDEQRLFLKEMDQKTAQIQRIYKEQLQIHPIPNECITFQFQMTKDGVVKRVEVDKSMITTENNLLITNLLAFFKTLRFFEANADYSTQKKFCFWN